MFRYIEILRIWLESGDFDMVVVRQGGRVRDRDIGRRRQVQRFGLDTIVYRWFGQFLESIPTDCTFQYRRRKRAEAGS